MRFLLFCLLLLKAISLEGAPSSIFWTSCTTDVLDTGMGDLESDNYFTLFYEEKGKSYFPPLIGFELGIFSWKNIKAEAGIDFLGGTDNPLYFNFGIGVSENILFSKAPALKISFFNAGTRCHGKNKTNQNIISLLIGKTLPEFIGGRFCFGGFSGSRSIGKENQGFMVSYQKTFCPAIDCENNEYFKWLVCADYASGKNAIGGGSLGACYYFTPYISLLTGPIWFNSKKINGNWKWSTQIDLNFRVFNP